MRRLAKQQRSAGVPPAGSGGIPAASSKRLLPVGQTNSEQDAPITRRLEACATSEAERQQIIQSACLEVARPVAFGVGIIMIVFLPILTLEGIEGKMFKPMALTLIFALLGSLILALTLTPVLASLFLPKQVKETEPWLVRLAHRLTNRRWASRCAFAS